MSLTIEPLDERLLDEAFFRLNASVAPRVWRKAEAPLKERP